MGSVFWRLHQVHWGWWNSKSKTLILGSVLLIISVRVLWQSIWRFWRVIKYQPIYLIIFIFLLGFGYFYVDYHWNKTDFKSYFSNESSPPVVIHGRVLKMEGVGTEQDWVIFITEVRLTETKDRVPLARSKIVVSESQCTNNVLPGDQVVVLGCLQAFSRATNPGEFDYQRYRRYNGFLAQLYGGQVYLVSRPEFSLLRLIERWKQKSSEFFSSRLSPKSYPLVMALLTGEDDYLNENNLQQIRNLGLSHLLAVSGLHLGLLATFVTKILKIIRVPTKIQPVILLLTVWFGVVFVGGEPSSLRVGIFLSLVQMGKILNRPENWVNLLAATAWLILLKNPLNVFLLSFQLSFIVYLSIMLGYTPVNDLFTQILPQKFVFSKIQSSLVLSLVAFLGSLPIILFHFYQISLQGIWMNLWAVPLIGFILPTLLFSLSFGWILPNGGIILVILERLVSLFQDLIIYFASKFTHIWRPGRPEILAIVVFYLGFWLLWRLWSRQDMPLFWRKKEKRNVVYCEVIIGLIMLGLHYFPVNNQSLEWVALDVGQGDGMFLRLPGDYVVLIDGGGRPGIPAQTGERIIAPFLLSRGITKIDLVCVSHFDADHVQGLLPIIRDFPVKMIWIPKGSQSNYARQVQTIAKVKQIPICYPYQGQSFTLGYTRIEILHPVSGVAYDEENRRSIVFRLTSQGRQILFTGDLGSEEEGELLDTRYNIQADLLKVGHHGSKNSSSLAFLKEVNPGMGLISVGSNRYGHPAREALERLQKVGCRVVRTDQLGAIKVIINQGKISVDYFCKQIK